MTDQKKRLSDGPNDSFNGGKLSRKGAPKGNAAIKVKDLKPNKKTLIHNGKKAGELTEQMRKFCEEYVFCFSKSESVRKAGYKAINPTSQANNLLALPQIQEYLSILRAERAAEDKDLKNRIKEELRIMAFSDTAELVALKKKADHYIKNKIEQPRELREEIELKLFEGRNGRLIKSVKHGRFGIEFSLYDKLEALNMLNRMGGNYEADNEQLRPQNSVEIYLPDNGRENKNVQNEENELPAAG